MKQLIAIVALACTLQAVAQPALSKRLDSLTAAYEANGYHGVVRIAKGNTPIYEKAYGLANFDKNIRHTPTTLFKTESAGKMFTAVSVLQLVEKRKLRLNQTVKELLPNLRIKNAEKITIHHLLNHTSGLQSPWDHRDWKFKKAYSRNELQRIVEEVPPAFDSAGREMYYSNSGYVVLSWIIEKATGKPFDQYLRQQIFSPLKMTSTWHLGDTVMPERNGAQPYHTLSSKKYIRMDETVGPYASGAGGWISTAKDLQLFMSALHSGKLLQPSTLQMMRTANGTAPADSLYRFYAYGLEVYHNQMIPGVHLYGHNGGGAGFAADAFTDPASGYTVTACANMYLNSRPVMENYFRLVLNKPLKPVARQASVRLYDVIEARGIDTVLANNGPVFKELNIQPHPGFLAQMSDAFLMAKDYTTWEKWMQWAQAMAADEPFLKVLYGDGLQQMGKKEEAHKSYEKAKQQAVQKNDQRALQYVEQKLKSL